MNASRLVLCPNSLVAIFAAMLYLSGVAMAADHPKDHKPADKTPPPQRDTFGDDGTPTFEDTPSPTFQPHPRPARQDNKDKDKEQKEKKERKDKDGGEIEIQATGPDLIILEIKVAPDNGTFGDSLVPNQGGTIQVTIKNQGNAVAAGDIRLDTWLHRTGQILTPPINPNDHADFVEHLGSLSNGASLSRSYSVSSFASVSGLYIPTAIVDRFNTIAETNELNNKLSSSYPVVVMGGVTPLGTIFAVGIPGSITFKFTTNPANANWPPGCPTTNGGMLTLGSITASGVKKGEATYTYSHASGVTGIDTLTGTCAASSRSGSVTIVGVDQAVLHGIVIGVGQSATIRFLTDPPNVQWPKGWPQRTLDLSVPNLATFTSMQTNIGFVDYVVTANATLTGVASLFNNCGTSSNFATITVLNGTLSTARFLNSVSLSFLQNNGTTIGNVPTLHWAAGSLANNQNSYALSQAAPVAYVRNNPLVLEVSVRIPPDLTNVLSITMQGTTAWTYGSNPVTASPFGTFAPVSATVAGGFATLQFTSSGSYAVVDVHSLTCHFVITRAFTADGSHTVSINAGSFTNRIYSLQGAPTGAWAIPTNYPPLIEVLELACKMSGGTGSSITAAGLLTNQIHRSLWTTFHQDVLFFDPIGTLVYNPISARTAFFPLTPQSQTFPLRQLVRDLGTFAFLQCNDINNFLAVCAQALGVPMQPLHIRNFNFPTVTMSLNTSDALTAGTDIVRAFVFGFHQIGTLNGFVYDAAVSPPQVHAPYSGETLAGYLKAVFPGFSMTTFNVTTLTLVGGSPTVNPNPFTSARILGGTLSISGAPGSSASVTLQVFNDSSITSVNFFAVPGGSFTSLPTISVFGTATTGTNLGIITLLFGIGTTTVPPTPLRIQIDTPRGIDFIRFDVKP